MLAFQKIRPYIALGSALIFVVSGMLPLEDVLGSIDFNVIFMIAGTMGIVAVVIASKMPYLLADIIIEKVPNVKWAIITLSLFAGVVSAFIDNVATVLMIAPIALCVAKELDINPVGMIIAISVSSNLQGAATLVGDTTAIMLGGYAGINFLEFFWYQGKPGIFWAVELGAVASALLLVVIFKKENGPVKACGRTEVNDYVPTIMLGATVLLLIIASIIPNMPHMINGIICMCMLVITLVYTWLKNRSIKAVLSAVKEIDFDTILLLLGLFIVVSGITHMGVVDALAGLFAKLANGNLFVIYTAITWFSVLISAFIDNIPYVATMLPVTQSIAVSMGVDPTILYFGLLSGATLGGNLTPVGASANIAGIGMLRKSGYEVKNRDFLRIGIPFTLAAIIPAYIYFWLLYA